MTMLKGFAGDLFGIIIYYFSLGLHTEAHELTSICVCVARW